MNKCQKVNEKSTSFVLTFTFKLIGLIDVEISNRSYHGAAHIIYYILVHYIQSRKLKENIGQKNI